MSILTTNRFSALCRWMVVVAVLVVPQLARATQWHATIGAQSNSKGRQALAFLPNEIWIHEGDSITWKFATDEIHTLTFLTAMQVRPPFPVGCPGFSSTPSTFDGSTCVTTPPLTTGATFTVDFPQTGNFRFVCLVHENMTGVVHVLALSKALPHGPEFYQDAADDLTRELLSDVDADTHLPDRDEHDGHHHVTVGRGEISSTPGGSNTLSVMRFMDHFTVIHAGQTVDWGSEDPITPHTITFGTEPADPMPPSSNVTVDADGALHATIHAVGDSVHSGFIIAAPQDRIGLPQSPLTPTRFRITFTKAGIYPYICALHDELGMKGEIIVLP
jgi:plastocyanin